MFRRKELLYIVLVQAAITVILSSATPNSGIVHPGAANQTDSHSFFQHYNKFRGY
jgi:hypothetical protein